MTRQVKELHDLLMIAVGLIMMEARDHDENRQWESVEQRKRVADTLRMFCSRAREAIAKVDAA
jgi:hypothetical protein